MYIQIDCLFLCYNLTFMNFRLYYLIKLFLNNNNNRFIVSLLIETQFCNKFNNFLYNFVIKMIHCLLV